MELTKLEYATIKIYCAMITTLDPPTSPDGDCEECDKMISQAIAGAHKLVKALENTPPNG